MSALRDWYVLTHLRLCAGPREAVQPGGVRVTHEGGPEADLLPLRCGTAVSYGSRRLCRVCVAISYHKCNSCTGQGCSSRVPDLAVISETS